MKHTQLDYLRVIRLIDRILAQFEKLKNIGIINV